MIVCSKRNWLFSSIVFASWCLIANIRVVDSFTVKNVRGRDFSGNFCAHFHWVDVIHGKKCAIEFSGDSNFEYDLLNQSSRSKSNIFTGNRDSDVLVRLAYRTFPKSFRETTIVATVQLNQTNGGYLFSILNPLSTIVQLGLVLVPVNRYIYNISLIYTDAKLHLNSQNLAVFQVPAFKEETIVGVKVFLNKVTLYLNCHEVRSVIVNDVDPVEIKIDADSRLYVASAGPISPNKFDASDNAGFLSSFSVYFINKHFAFRSF